MKGEHKGRNIYGYEYLYNIVPKFQNRRHHQQNKNDDNIKTGLIDNIAKQPEFQFKDCHLRVKIRMISIIQCDELEFLNFYADCLNRF